MEKKITVDELRSIVYNVHFYDEDDNDLLKQHCEEKMYSMPCDDKEIVTVKSSISGDFCSYDDALKFAKKVVSSDQFNSALICMSISGVRDNIPITAIQSYVPMSREEIEAARKDAKEVKTLETALNKLQDYKDAKDIVLRYEADQRMRRRFKEKLAKETVKENIE